ncbi:MAG TPA: hypothetical protein VFT38_07860 [Vicinamibacteria bacterium]|nr:hypothetical protein [Vicinamibacteria bacterium]
MLALSALLAVTAAAAAGTSDVGPWKVVVNEDRVLVSQEADTSWPGGAPRLVLRCTVEVQRGELKFVKHTARIKEAYLFYGAGFPADQGSLLASFEGEPKPRSYWGAPSQDGKSLFVSGTLTRGGPDAFIRAMLQHARMTLAVKLRKKDALPDLAFDLARLDDALAQWQEKCPIKEK